MNRIDLGFARTVCECSACASFCTTMPGMLIPSDLDRLIPEGADVLEWAAKHLLASPGAVVARDGNMFRIPTLVPARHGSDASCHWLGGDGRCSVHADAPYGCAMFDEHQSAEEGNRRSKAGLLAIAKAFSEGGLYAILWTHLAAIGRHAADPAVLRRMLATEKGGVR